jgi:UMF1 family MFS transporter
LVARFAPAGRSGEFLGLWNVAVKLATAVGPITFGLISYLTASNFRIALLSTEVFLVLGTIMLFRVNEKRGIAASHLDVSSNVSTHEADLVVTPEESASS